MRSKDRPPSFQFYPRDLLSSTSFNLMTPEQRGGYLALLAHAWLQPRPGWLPDDPRVLASLSGLAERWADCRTAIARAFQVRRGWWIQSRMVSERRAQQRRYFQAKKGARVTNSKRWSSVAMRSDSESRFVTPASASASASAVESTESKEESVARAPRSPHRRPTTPDRNLPDTFRQEMATRFGLPSETVADLAERLLLEFDARGYKNAKSALITWCRREKEHPRPNPTANGDQPYDDGLDRARRLLAEMEAKDA